METQFEVWNKLTMVFEGAYATKEEAVAVAKGSAMYYGIFFSDFQIIRVTNV